MNCVVRRGVVTLAQHRPLITFPVRTPLTPVLPPPLTAAQLNQNVCFTFYCWLTSHVCVGHPNGSVLIFITFNDLIAGFRFLCLINITHHVLLLSRCRLLKKRTPRLEWCWMSYLSGTGGDRWKIWR